MTKFERLCVIYTLTETAEDFCAAFAEGQKELNLSDRELAKIFQISLPTVGRWVRGEAARHQIGRGPTLAALLRRLNVNTDDQKELQKLRQEKAIREAKDAAEQERLWGH